MSFWERLELTNRETWPFIPGLAVMLVLSAIMLAIADKGDYVLALNDWHGSSWDMVFRYGTWLGDGVFWMVILIALLFYNWRQALMFGIATSVNGLLTGLLKDSYNLPRPKNFFDEGTLQFVEHVDVHGMRSFPSGHTSMAFLGFFVLAFLLRRRPWASAFCLFMAAQVGLSRIYLSQHFLIDVFTGAALGTLIAWIVISWLRRYKFFGVPEEKG